MLAPLGKDRSDADSILIDNSDGAFPDGGHIEGLEVGLKDSVVGMGAGRGGRVSLFKRFRIPLFAVITIKRAR